MQNGERIWKCTSAIDSLENCEEEGNGLWIDVQTDLLNLE
jgi:hypothetical protein